MPRCSERASVSFSTPQPKLNGNGDAYQSWNSDQPTATAKISLPTAPPTLRPPVSASATSCWSSGLSACAGSATLLLDPALLLVILRRAIVQRRRQAVAHHVLRVQVGKRRVQLLELVEVLEHRSYDLVDRVGRHLR